MYPEFPDLPWGDLKDKGYLCARAFLSPDELQILQTDWGDRVGVAKGTSNGNYPIVDVPQAIIWRLHRKLKLASEAIYAATGIMADVDAGGCAYYSTSRGINFPWHQDHEPFFVYQQSLDYLLFWTPVIKPVTALSNMSVIPMDALQKRIPERFAEYHAGGAKRFSIKNGVTHVHDDVLDIEYDLPFSLDELQVTPELEAGDLLLIRGDVIHRTQDNDTDRVAVAFRRTRSSAQIRKSIMLSGTRVKQDMMDRNPNIYRTLLECFEKHDCEEITGEQFQSYYQRKVLAS